MRIFCWFQQKRTFNIDILYNAVYNELTGILYIDEEELK